MCFYTDTQYFYDIMDIYVAMYVQHIFSNNFEKLNKTSMNTNLAYCQKVIDSIFIYQGHY